MSFWRAQAKTTRKWPTATSPNLSLKLAWAKFCFRNTLERKGMNSYFKGPSHMFSLEWFFYSKKNQITSQDRVKSNLVRWRKNASHDNLEDQEIVLGFYSSTNSFVNPVKYFLEVSSTSDFLRVLLIFERFMKYLRNAMYFACENRLLIGHL